ncbi:MAG: pyrroline-5-carboxylate reductase [Deltaproteobacteria bacterium]|nr:pyrroline-5-carboxylate reductase [Deltaproteobacteria bacterium]
MGEALIKGLQASKHSKDFAFQATTRSIESAAEATKRLAVECHTDNQKLAAGSKVLVLCVKPHQAQTVLSELASKLTADHLIISVCASVTTAQISEWSGGRAAVVRAMPNTPCLIGEGMTVFCAGQGVKAEHMRLTENIFNTVGRAIALEEPLMDGVTGLSGCGPAYIYLIIEALSEAGVKVGLPRKTATLLAAQTMAGAARMVLERGEHPAALKDEVTTPAGCTIDGLMALEEGKLRVTLIKAVLAAAKRSKSLGKK